MLILSLFGIYLLVPAVIHVNSMNDKDGVAFKNNSKLTWHSTAFTLMTFPILALILMGLFME
jgi:hypothetical protein